MRRLHKHRRRSSTLLQHGTYLGCLGRRDRLRKGPGGRGRDAWSWLTWAVMMSATRERFAVRLLSKAQREVVVHPSQCRTVTQVPPHWKQVVPGYPKMGPIFTFLKTFLRFFWSFGVTWCRSTPTPSEKEVGSPRASGRGSAAPRPRAARQTAPEIRDHQRGRWVCVLHLSFCFKAIESGVGAPRRGKCSGVEFLYIRDLASTNNAKQIQTLILWNQNGIRNTSD